ncbi:helix-turn-helix domain-containing protein, partial [Escherichia coli]
MTEKIDELLNSKNITKSQLSKESGIPYTTISGFYV